MKNVYVLSRIVTPNEPGVLNMPVLGVHGNRIRCEEHLASIIQDRERLGFHIVYDRRPVKYKDGNRQEVRNVMMQKGSEVEYFFVEKIKV